MSGTEAFTVAKASGMDLATAFEAIKISSGTSFVPETESQVILNGSSDISFTMEIVAKDLGLFQEVADRADVELELSPLLISIFNDGIEKFGPGEFRQISSNVWRSSLVCPFSQMAFWLKWKIMSQNMR